MAGGPGRGTASNGTLVLAVAVGVAVGASAAALVAMMFAPSRSRSRREGKRTETAKSKSSTEIFWHQKDLRPPLPPDVVRLLQSSKLCFLSTFCDDHPHLSLMNFTYCPDDEVIILSTRRDTKKYKLVQNARQVAILVHDFPTTGATLDEQNNSSSLVSPKPGSKLTITLNGSAYIQEGELAERYRGMHAENNPNSATFIVGENIAIITVRVQTARICNVHDQVTLWDVAQSAGTTSTVMNTKPAMTTGSGGAGSTAPCIISSKGQQ